MFRTSPGSSKFASTVRLSRTPTRLAVVTVLAGSFLALGIVAGPASPAFAAGSGCGTTTVPTGGTTGNTDPGSQPPVHHGSTPVDPSTGGSGPVDPSSGVVGDPVDPGSTTHHSATTTTAATEHTSAPAASGVVGTVRHALAVTGHNILPAFAGAFLLLFVGIGAVVVARRRA